MEIAHDYEGIRIAAGEMLAEAMMAQHRQRIQRQMDGASPENLESALRATQITRTMADPCYGWVEHLFFLEHAALAPMFLQAAESRGLTVIAQARREFDGVHPPCPGCGLRMVERHAPCGNCAFDPSKAKAA